MACVSGVFSVSSPRTFSLGERVEKDERVERERDRGTERVMIKPHWNVFFV
jgi:hypothetical protein